MWQSLKGVLERVLRGVNAVRVGALLLRESREDSARWFKVALGQAAASLAIAALVIAVSDPPARGKKSKDKDAVEVKIGGLTVRREKDKPPKVTPAAAPIAVTPSEGAVREAVRAKRKTRAQRTEDADRAVEQAARALARRLGAKVEPGEAVTQPWVLRLGLPGEPPAVSPPLALPEDAARPADDAPLWDLAAAVIDAAVRDDAQDDAQRAQAAVAAVGASPGGGASVAAPVAGAAASASPVEGPSGVAPVAGAAVVASPVEGPSAVAPVVGAAVGASPVEGPSGASAAASASPVEGASFGAPVAGAAVGASPVEGAPGAEVGASPGSPVGPAAEGAPAVAATDEAQPDDDEDPAVGAPQTGASGTARATPDPAAKGDDDEEPERFADWPLLAALARWSGAVLAAQLLVVALTRDHSEVTENALARAVGLPVPPPRTPKVRLDVRWLLRRLQRRMWTTFALIPLGIALSPLLLFVPGLGRVLLSLGAAWLVVVGTTAKDGRAWEADLAANEPRSVSALREATERHRALDWFLPRTLVRIHGRFVRRLQGPMNAAEGAPFELAGVALTRTLALIPFVGLLLRPIVPVAVAAFVPRLSPRPEPEAVEATASAPTGAALQERGAFDNPLARG